jgi:L-alanine-DL-glutamate epimerase-like enolase superfamily enzyme
MGPGTAAFVHLAVAASNVTVPSDLVSPELLVDDICTTPFKFENGALKPFAAPGLGVELDEAKMEKWGIS